MSDSKKSTNKVRKPFLWRRKQEPTSEIRGIRRGLRTSAIRAFLAQAGAAQGRGRRSGSSYDSADASAWAVRH